MVDWAEPTNGTTESTLLDILKARDESAATLDFSGDSNIINGAIKFNAATPALDKYNGSTWDQVFGASEIDHDSLLNYDANQHKDATANETISGTWNFTTALKALLAYFTGTDSVISTDTSDASDTKALSVAGGGSNSTTRGAYLKAHGNEHASKPGDLQLRSGAVSGGAVELDTGSSDQDIKVMHGGTDYGRFRLVNGYPSLVLGADAIDTLNGAIVHGSDNVTINSTSWTTVLRLDPPADSVFLLDVFCCGRRNSGASNAATTNKYTVKVERFGSGTPVLTTVDLWSSTTGSTDLEFRVVISTNVFHVQARLIAGVGQYQCAASMHGAVQEY